jgi:hypothetical protein
MGDINQLRFIQRHAARFTGPYLEVGSLNYGSTQDLRSIFAKRDVYMGIDLKAGAGWMWSWISPGMMGTYEKLGGLQFGTIFV